MLKKTKQVKLKFHYT